MAWAKVKAGVLRLETQSGPRFLQLSFTQRLRALWVFRNFRALSLDNLYGWQRDLLNDVCHHNEFVSWRDVDRAGIIGTVEKAPFSVVVRSGMSSATVNVAGAAQRQA